MRTPHPVRSSLLVAVLGGALLAGCGSSDSKDSSSSSSGSGGASTSTTPKAAAPATSGTKVTIAGFKYKPANLSVAVGAKVTFTNEDSSNHTATGPGLATGSLSKGQSKTVTFAKKGTIAYICDFHPFMKGTITVH